MADGRSGSPQPATRLLRREVRRLAREVRALRGGLLSVLGEDREGHYNPRFVEDILRAANERPTATFSDAATFVKALRRRAWRSSSTRTS